MEALLALSLVSIRRPKLERSFSRRKDRTFPGVSMAFTRQPEIGMHTAYDNNCVFRE
jgi:hypothetical protein